MYSFNVEIQFPNHKVTKQSLTISRFNFNKKCTNLKWVQDDIEIGSLAVFNSVSGV